MKNYLPQENQNKIICSNFGNFIDFFKNTEYNIDFDTKYRAWTKKLENYPDLIYISTSTINKIEIVHEFLIENKNINGLLICSLKNITKKKNDNILIYNKPVYKNIENIFSQCSRIIGIVTHTNISVPTSIYLFASFGIPILAFDMEPISSLLKEYSLGEVFKDKNDIVYSYNNIKSNYSYYNKNCIKFIKINSWHKAAQDHNQLFM